VHFECLTKNVPEEIETHQLAVGNEQKMICLSEDNFTQSKRVIGEGTIPMVTVDSLGINDIDVIKIDVEGYEMEVLKGATKTLENTQYLMIELNNNTKKYGSSNIAVEKFISSLGFTVLLDHWPDKVFYRA
jgi:FkbM family methyltransferase